MFKYVDVPSSCDKIVISGATCDELFFKFLDLNKDYFYDQIIVHVGVNYLKYNYNQHKEDIAYEIANFLNAIRDIAPSTKITFSRILPKRHDDGEEFAYMNAIDYINFKLHELAPGIDHIFYDQLVRDRYLFSIICRDGLHLNRFGVKLVTNVIQKYLQNFGEMM